VYRFFDEVGFCASVGKELSGNLANSLLFIADLEQTVRRVVLARKRLIACSKSDAKQEPPPNEQLRSSEFCECSVEGL